MADFWRLLYGGAMALTESGVWAMTVLAQLHFFGSGILVVRIVSSRRAWSSCRTSCQLSKLSSSILDDKVDLP
jgi:hypothetical protein